MLREIVTSVKDADGKHADKAGSIFLVFEYMPYDLTGLIESPLV
jgi:hypothetical protein